MFSTLADIMIHVRDIMIHVGDITSTSGEYYDTCGGYHEYIEGCSVHRGFQYKSKHFINLLPT